MKLTTLGAKQDFPSAFYIKTNAPIAFSSYFIGANFDSPVFIGDKYTRGVRINAIAVSKTFKNYEFMMSFYYSKCVWKKWEKNIHHEPVHVG